ncbi:MAG TPA: HlyU family transcriptional regulator [Aestuariivirgaceae bacterium]|jgi:hypothetical protein
MAVSFFKSLFGLAGARAGNAAAAGKQVEHNGFLIKAQPYREGGRYQTAGIISKDIDGVRKEHKFIRADSFSTFDEAAEFSLSKGRQIVDEQGDHLFGDASPR